MGVSTAAPSGPASKPRAYQTTERAAHLQGTWVDPRAGEIRFGDYATTWLAQRPLRPKTIDLYTYLIRSHILPEFADTELRAISPARVRAWNAKLHQVPTLSPSTVAKSYRLLRTILTTAIEDELIIKNPCLLKGASVEHHDERPVATLDQIDASPTPSIPATGPWSSSPRGPGCALGELAGLRALRHRPRRPDRPRRTPDPRAPDGTVTSGPQNRRRSPDHRHPTPHPPRLADHLAALGTGDPDGLRVPLPRRHPSAAIELQRPVLASRLRKPSGSTGFHFHDLRHTGNTLAASTGASTKELMARMGHASARAALIYQHATAERDRALADALLAWPPSRDAATGPQPRPNVRSNVRSTPSGPSNVTPIRRQNPGQRSGDDGTRTHDFLLAKQVL